MAAKFRITPGTDIVVSLDKATYEVGETVVMDIDYHVDLKDAPVALPIKAWRTWVECHYDGQQINSGMDAHSYSGTGEANCICHNALTFVAESVGTVNGHVEVKGDIGLL